MANANHVSFEKYKADIDKLVSTGAMLQFAMYLDVYPECREKLNPEGLKKIPKFNEDYQSWYSEALACVSQLIPNRREDFISYYKPLKPRRHLDAENYTISDYLRGLSSTNPLNNVGPSAALCPFEQQFKIVEALKQRFESALFDIRALVQADLFDNELDAVAELNKKGFQRAAGAVAGVVLEEYLATVCQQHMISVPKNATISKLNDLLKEKEVLDVPTWRFVQRLGDLRNLCDHKRPQEPTVEDIDELVAGVRKVTKTVF
jgi:hypothetical protein